MDKNHQILLKKVDNVKAEAVNLCILITQSKCLNDSIVYSSCRELNGALDILKKVNKNLLDASFEADEQDDTDDECHSPESDKTTASTGNSRPLISGKCTKPANNVNSNSMNEKDHNAGFDSDGTDDLENFDQFNIDEEDLVLAHDKSKELQEV